MDEPRNPSDQPLPGSVSDQNNEEAEPGHDDQHEARRSPGEAGGSGRDGGDGGDSSGESGEGSQSTGSPDSAG
jgi:hypothetical protein